MDLREKFFSGFRRERENTFILVQKTQNIVMKQKYTETKHTKKKLIICFPVRGSEKTIALLTLVY